MDIKEYSVTDLRRALSENEWWDLPVIPITKHRALAHINNPRADESDIILVVAYDGSEVIGYMGVIPDKIYVHGEEHKIGWLSTWWRDPKKGPAGLGTDILLKVLQCWQMNIGGREFSVKAGRVFKRLNFIWPGSSRGESVLIRFNTRELLPNRFPILGKARWLLDIFDAIGNSWMNLRSSSWQRSKGLDKCLSLEYVREIDKETRDFIARNRKKELTCRGANELDWMLKYPWVLPTPLKDITSSRYFFSSVAKEFQFFSVKIFDAENIMIGFLVFRLRDGHLTLPYAYFDSKYSDKIVRVVGHHIFELKAHRFTIFIPEIMEHFLSEKIPFVYKRKRSREIVMTRKFKNFGIEDCYLQDGDADCAFT